MASKYRKEVDILKAHLSLNVKSVAASSDFYQKLFGIEPSKVRTGYAKFDVHNPPLNLTLNEGPAVPGGAVSHLGLHGARTRDGLAIRPKGSEQGRVTRAQEETKCCCANYEHR